MLVFFFSCQHENYVDEIKINKNNSNCIFLLKTQNFINTTTLESKNINIYPRENNFSLTYSESNTKGIKTVTDKFKIYPKNDVSSVILYFEKNTDNVNAISLFVYNQRDMIIYHELFKFNGVEFMNITSWNLSTCNSILPGYIELLGNIIDPTINKSCLIFNVDSKNYLLRKPHGNNFEKLILDKSKFGFRSSGCTIGMCKLDLETKNCGVHPEGGLDCGVPGSDSEDCPKDELEEGLEEQEEVIVDTRRTDYVKTNTQLAYNIKEYLNSFDKGTKYVNYYYFIGKILIENNVIKENRLTFFEAFVRVINIGNKLLTQNDTSVLITNSDFIFFNDLIDSLLVGQSNNAEYINILTIVKDDLIHFRNKPTNVVKNEIVN